NALSVALAGPNTRDPNPSGRHAGAGSMPHQSDGNGSGRFGEGGVPLCSAAVAAPARLRYQSLGSGQPSASSVTNEYPDGIPCTGTSEAWGSILNMAVPSFSSSNIAP